MADEFVMELKRIIRVKSADAEGEIEGLIASCKKELEIAGIFGTINDPLYRQAIRLYCKANFGYDADTGRFQNAYESLRDAMALSGDYKE